MKPNIAGAIAAALILTACSDSHQTLAPDSDTGPAFIVAAGHVAGIEDVIAAQDAAWAAKDAIAYGNTYTEDTEVIAPIGLILTGRATVQAQHAFLFNPVNGFFRSSTSVWSLRSLTFLTGAIALVKLDVTLTGFSGLPPGLQATEPGVVRTRVTWVAVKQGAEWKILHQQMTAIPPAT
jgi:uncharacterized protein (TIGR02246 family)